MYRSLAPEPGKEEREEGRRERRGGERGGEGGDERLKERRGRKREREGGRERRKWWHQVVTCSSLEGVMSCTRLERNCVSSVLSRRGAACGMVSPTSDQSKMGRMRGGGGYGCLHT